MRNVGFAGKNEKIFLRQDTRKIFHVFLAGNLGLYVWSDSFFPRAEGTPVDSFRNTEVILYMWPTGALLRSILQMDA